MKQILDWQQASVVNIYDELSLWSAPFGALLLKYIPMKRGMAIADIGFGTGFPLIELSQRFGNDSKIYGIDIWEEGIKRTKEKIRIFDIENITILTESANKINLENDCIDLVTSNIGVNNFENREKVYSEIYRILHIGGRLCITTNPKGTFDELFSIFQESIEELGLTEENEQLEKYISSRNTIQQIISEVEGCGLRCNKQVAESSEMRFVDSMALFNHGLMRIGFRQGWDQLIRPENRIAFFEKAASKIDEQIRTNGSFKISIPILYLEFEK